jgi:hypothetical protein
MKSVTQYLNNMKNLLVPILTLLTPKVVGAQIYTSLSKATELGLEDGIPDFGTFLNTLFTWGISFAGIIAVIVIIFGGIQYMTTDAVAGKSEGKEKIKRAFTGLIIVLSSILVLNTINPRITTFNLGFENQTIRGTAFTIPDEDYFSSMVATSKQTISPSEFYSLSDAEKEKFLEGAGVHNTQFAQDFSGTTQLGTARESILATAKEAVVGEYSTCSISGTNGGRLACAISTDTVVGIATGVGIGRTTDEKFSTAQMVNALNGSSSFSIVPGGLSNSTPGDIVISPTEGSRIGHVGIVSDNGRIISNSSSNGKMMEHFTTSGWESSYGGKGLDIKVFSPN